MMARHRCIALAMLTAILAGCGAGGPAMTPAGSSSETPPSPVSTSSPETSPAADPSMTSTPGQDEPPDALLSAEGGDTTPGQLGSYTWLGAGSDAPWLPGAPIAVGTGEPLSIRLEPDGDIVSWRARFVEADQTDPIGARSLGEGTGTPAFPAPETGSWTAEVSVDFGPDVGSASYFWRLDVR